MPFKNPDRKVVDIDYTNWRGERATRRIIPISLIKGSNQWHPEEQWLVEAEDLGKNNEVRTFALNGIHAWCVCPSSLHAISSLAQGTSDDKADQLRTEIGRGPSPLQDAD